MGDVAEDKEAKTRRGGGAREKNKGGRKRCTSEEAECDRHRFMAFPQVSINNYTV